MGMHEFLYRVKVWNMMIALFGDRMGWKLSDGELDAFNRYQRNIGYRFTVSEYEFYGDQSHLLEQPE